jgi:hypothetical protein
MSRQDITARATRRSDRRFAALRPGLFLQVVGRLWEIRDGTDCLSRQSRTRLGGRPARRRP